jgi:hypothetical protein
MTPHNNLTRKTGKPSCENQRRACESPVKKWKAVLVFMGALALYCLSPVTASALLIEKNFGTTAAEGSSANSIDNGMLLTTDADGADLITYTIDVPPASGTLRRSGTGLGVGSTFTQKNIDDGQMSYDHDGSEGASDSFNFTVRDNTGGEFLVSSFTISVAENDASVAIMTPTAPVRTLR